MPCEKDHIVSGHEIPQRGLTEDIAEHTLGKNWSTLYCSPLGREVSQRKLSGDYFREQKYGRKPILVGRGKRLTLKRRK